MKLHSYFRSGAAWRVRIGLHWKGVPFETVGVDLRTGAQASAAHRAVNPQAMVPALVLDDGTVLTQSLAILEWLEETRPEPAFLPPDPLMRAHVRAVVQVIASDTHPVQNLGVLKRVEGLFAARRDGEANKQAGADAAKAWAAETIARGLATVEALLARHAPGHGPFAFGSEPTLADIIMTPQLLNARRFGVDLAPYPRIRASEAACAKLPAFMAAHPDNQPDAD